VSAQTATSAKARAGLRYCEKHASARFRPLEPADRHPVRRLRTSVPVDYERIIANASDGSVARYYDPTTGQFLSLDPDVEETMAPFTYAADDPVNLTDPLGLNDCGVLSVVCDLGHIAAGTPRDVGVAIKTLVNPTGCDLGRNADGSCRYATYWRDVIDVPQDAIYLVYWGSYEAIGGLETLGSYLPGSCTLNLGSFFGIPFITGELVGIAGQGLGSLIKGQTVWLQGIKDQPLLGNEVLGPFHGRQVTQELGLPFLIFPGYGAQTHQVQLRW
jgi:hypothetical protein